MLCNLNHTEFGTVHDTFENALSQFVMTVIDVKGFDINTFEEHNVHESAAGSDVESTDNSAAFESDSTLKNSSDWSRLQTRGWVRKLRKKCACVNKYYYTNPGISPHEVSTIKQALRMNRLHILKKRKQNVM